MIFVPARKHYVNVTLLIFLFILQALMIFFQQLLLFISLIFVGHISGDSLELDAAGEGISLSIASKQSLLISGSYSLAFLKESIRKWKL